MYFFFEKGYPSVTISTGNHLQFSSVTQSCPTLCDPINHSTPGLPVHHQLPESTQTHVHWVGDAIQPSHPLSSPLLLPSIFPSIRVFSNESALCIRWPKAWVKNSITSIKQGFQSRSKAFISRFRGPSLITGLIKFCHSHPIAKFLLANRNTYNSQT